MKFINKVVRQGTSLCVRIPNNVVKGLNLKEKEEVIVRMKKLEIKELEPELIKEYFKLYNSKKELKKYSRTKFLLLISLSFYAGKHMMKHNSTQEEVKNAWSKILSDIEKEYGTKILKEFEKFTILIGKLM